MKRASALLWFVFLGMIGGSCSECGKPKAMVERVRWPASMSGSQTSAFTATRKRPSFVIIPPAREAAPDDDDGSVPDQDASVAHAPFVRVREGYAHDLRYLEVVFGDVEFDDPLPLVVLIHGRGDRPRVPGGPFGGVPTPMRLVMPQAPLPLGDGFSWLSVSITHNRPDLLATSLRKRTDHVAALINTLRTTRPTLGRPIVAGFSQGGMLSYALALFRPDAVGVALPLAGWVPPALMPTAPVAEHLRVPIRSVHGSADPIVPMEPTRAVVERLRELGWDVEFVIDEGVEHVVSDRMNAQFEAWLEEALREQAPELVGKGLGQDGPEGTPYEPYDPMDPETQDAIDQFDRQARRDSEGTDAGVAPAADAGTKLDDAGSPSDAEVSAQGAP